MQFPLDIITGFFSESGIMVRKEPHRPKDRFTWISALREVKAEDPRSFGFTGSPVFVVGANDIDEEAGATHIVVMGPTDAVAVPERSANNDIYISSTYSPATVADKLQRYLMRIIQWNDEMADLLDSRCICQDLLKHSEPILKCYIGLSDSTYSYIAHTPNIAPIDSASRYFIKNKLYGPGTLRKVRERGLIKKWENQEWTAVHNEPNDIISRPCIDHVFRLNNAYAAHMVLVSPSEISTAKVFLFDLLAKKVDLCLTRHWRRENPLDQRYTYFLKELLTGNTYGDAYLEERAKRHGLPLTGLFKLCLVDNTWRVGSANYFAKKVIEMEPGCKIAFEGSRVVVLLCASEPKPGIIASMESHIFELAHRMHLEVGVSDRFEHLEQSALELDKARIALKYGHRKSRMFAPFNGEPTCNEVFRFRRYFPYYATDPFARSDKFIVRLLASPNPLAKLREADKERGTSDFEVLRTYLYCEGSIKDACEIMHLHRNTMNYRLEKIRKTIAADFDDPDMRMYLRILYFLTE